MKWIKYKVVQSTVDGETVFLDKKVGYSAENLAIVTAEAYNGSYTIEEDATTFANEPLGIVLGGTGARTAADALVKLGALSSAAGAVGTSNLAADAVKLTFTNVELPVGWMATSDRYAAEGFPYFGAIPLTGATASMTPEVVFSVADAMSGIFAPVAETYDGGVYIYASELPSATTITLPTIILWR